jgi:hypothetical protein
MAFALSSFCCGGQASVSWLLFHQPASSVISLFEFTVDAAD